MAYLKNRWYRQNVLAVKFLVVLSDYSTALKETLQRYISNYLKYFEEEATYGVKHTRQITVQRKKFSIK